MVLMIIMLVLVALMLFGMGYFYFKIFPIYESHWRATEHELNEAWCHINTLEGYEFADEVEENERLIELTDV